MVSIYQQHVVAASRIIMVINDQICLMIQLLALVMKLSSILQFSLHIYLSVDVRKRQVIILARSSRGMSQTGRSDCRSFLSRVCISIRPSNFYMQKTPKNNSRKPCRPRDCLFEWTSDRPWLFASEQSKRGGNCFMVGGQRPIEQR